MKDRTVEAQANAKRLAARLNVDRPATYNQAQEIIELLKEIIKLARECA